MFPALKSEKSLYYNGENITLHCYVKGGICNISFTYLNDDLISSDFVTIINNTYARLDKLVKEDDPYETRYSCHNDCNGSKQVALIYVFTECKFYCVISSHCLCCHMCLFFVSVKFVIPVLVFLFINITEKLFLKFLK